MKNLPIIIEFDKKAPLCNSLETFNNEEKN